MPAINRESRKYLILGIHGKDVPTVDGSVARVRMFVNGEQVDEDFPLPDLALQLGPNDSRYTFMVQELLRPIILQRVAEIESGAVEGTETIGVRTDDVRLDQTQATGNADSLHGGYLYNGEDKGSK